MQTDITFQQDIIITGPISELQDIKDVAECVKDFGPFITKVVVQHDWVTAYCLSTQKISHDDCAEYLDQAYVTVTGVNF